MTGADAEKRCDAAGIVLNKNAIPFDPQPASIASGIRVGSPAVTTQGMVETDKSIASLIGTAIRDAGQQPRPRSPPVSAVGRCAPRTPSGLRRALMREYAVVLLTAALVTFLATPVVRMVAIRFRMMAAPRERDVHVIPTPRGGGVAMYLGVAAAILVASRRAAADVRRLADLRCWSPAG